VTQGHAPRAGQPTTPPPGAGDDLQTSARAVLRERLRRVERQLRRLEPSDHSPTPQAQHVHRLRVAIRRADAGMAAFRGVFGHGPWKRTRNALRSVRQAAGAVRQVDVHLAMLRHERGDADAPLAASVEGLMRVLRKDRRAAVRRLDRELGSVTPRCLRRLRRRLLASESGAAIEGAPSTLAELSSRVGAELSQRLQASRLDVSAGLEGLHRVRLLCKRVRYSVEVFAPCLDRLALADASEALTRVQDRLGAINDLHELVSCIDALAPVLGPPPIIARGAVAPARPPVDLLPARRLFSERLERAVDEFLAWASAGGWSDFVSRVHAAFSTSASIAQSLDVPGPAAQSIEPRVHAGPIAPAALQPVPPQTDVPAVIVTQSARAVPIPARGRASGRDPREDARGGVRA